jgi:hypothetical protein
LPRLGTELARHAASVRHAGREEALALLGAAPKAAANLRWFARVYPGSMVHYVVWFWASGFPANLRQVGGPWLAQVGGLLHGGVGNRMAGIAFARRKGRSGTRP